MNRPVALDRVDVLELVPFELEPPEDVGVDWSCPGCGDRKLVARGSLVHVRERTPDRRERWVLLCADCAPRGPVA